MSNKYRSFAITIRPPSGLYPTSEYELAILAYIKKAEYQVYAFEMEGEARHIHAQVWFAEARSINDIRKTFFRIGEKYDCDWSYSAQKVTSKGIKIAYNDDFIDYILKQSHIYDKYNCSLYPDVSAATTAALYDDNMNAPPVTDDYYPSKKEQEEVMSKAAINKAADPYFARLKHLWNKEFPDYNEANPAMTELEDIPRFYFNQMYKEKTISVIRNERDRKANAKSLYYYIFPTYNTKAMLTQAEAEIIFQMKNST